MSRIQKPKGTLDILPGDISLWQYIETAVRETAKLNGFSEIRMPTFSKGQKRIAEYILTNMFMHTMEGSTTEIPNGDSTFNVGDTLVIVTTGRGSIRQLNDIFA